MAVVCLVCSRLVVFLCETCVQTAVIVRSACTVWVVVHSVCVICVVGVPRGTNGQVSTSKQAAAIAIA